MKIIMHLSLAMLVLAAASAAPAQRFKLSDAQSRQVTADFARCAVKARPDLASQAVVEDWEAKQLVGEGSKLLIPACVRAGGLIQSIRFQIGNIRAALAEQLVLRDASVSPTIQQLAPLAPLAHHLPWPIRTIDAKGRPLKPKAIAAQTRAWSGPIRPPSARCSPPSVTWSNLAGVRSTGGQK